MQGLGHQVEEATRHISELVAAVKLYTYGEGTGLGLDIALRIVCRRHKGDIHVHSQPGNTVFAVSLPINAIP